jgi:uncharacterized protein YjbI with pentapeptide repeats
MMNGGAEFATIELANAHVGGQLVLNSSKITGKLIMNGLHIDGDLMMFHKAEFADVDLVGARVGGQLNLGGSKVSGTFGCESLEVMRPVVMNDGVIFSSPIDCRAAKIKSDLYLDDGEFKNVNFSGAEIDGKLILFGSKVNGKLDLSGLQVGNLLNADKAEFTNVDLRAAHVSGRLSLKGSKIAGAFECYGLEVGQQFFMSAGAVFGGPIDCRVAKIKGDLYLDDAKFKQDVDFSGAEINGGLHIGSAQWSPNVTLTLRNAKMDLIPALVDAWPPKLDMDGFIYRDAGAADQFEPWFRKLGRYASQPYDRLASVVQNQGNVTLATRIRYSGRERERDEAKGARWTWLTVIRSLIGYGYYPELAWISTAYN